MHKIKQTVRKFYNKWLYKISLTVPGAHVFRMIDLEKITNFLNKLSHNQNSINFHTLNKSVINRRHIQRISSRLGLIDHKSYFIRVEQDRLDIYVNEQQLFDDLCIDLQDIIVQAFCPDKEKIALLDRKVILVKKYPKEDFKYRVYLKPHVIKHKAEKHHYLAWLDLNLDYNMSDSVRSWFITTEWNWDRRYMLVRNEPALLMMKLRNADAMGSVYEYVICDK